MTTDAELLQAFASERSQAAFTELVQRHAALVYRAALRQVGDHAHLAHDVTQAVFTTLALKAASLPRHVVLVAWLYATTHYVVANARRTERRRQVREFQAFLIHEISTDADSSADWNRLRPVLDDAMLTLGPFEREALLLRFFADRSFSEVGAALRISEEAARKRVDRGLEKLRGALAARGIVSTAAAISTLLAHQPAVGVPLGLATSVASTALAGVAAADVLANSATGLFGFMTATKAIALSATLALVASGIAWHTHRELQRTNAALARSNQERDVLRAERVSRNASRPSPEATASTRDTPSASDDPTIRAAADIVDRVQSLKQKLAARPDQQIPELQFVIDAQWIAAASGEIEDEASLARAFHNLRNYGKARFAGAAAKALASYAQANSGQLPTDILQLQPYVEPPVDAALLQRYQVIRSGRYDDISDLLPVISEVAVADDKLDSIVRISKRSSSVTNVRDAANGAVERAIDAFVRAHQGEMPAEASQLAPYLRIPVDPSTLAYHWRLIAARSTGSRVYGTPPAPLAQPKQ